MKVVLQELSHLFISVSLQHRCFVSFRATVEDRSLTAAAAAACDATKEYLILAKLTSSWSAGEHMLRPMGSIFFRAATMSDVCTEYRSPRFFFLVRSASEPPPWEETPHTREHSQNLLKCPQRHTEISASCDNNVFFTQFYCYQTVLADSKVERRQRRDNSSASLLSASTCRINRSSQQHSWRRTRPFLLVRSACKAVYFWILLWRNTWQPLMGTSNKILQPTVPS